MKVKVWVVLGLYYQSETEPNYHSTHVEGVFFEESKAKEFYNAKVAGNKHGGWEDYEIEESEIE